MRSRMFWFIYWFGSVLTVFFADRDQLDNQDESSLSPENVARELGFSEEAEPCDMRRENQRRETDQSSGQECGYAMLTPRTMMVIFS